MSNTSPFVCPEITSVDEIFAEARARGDRAREHHTKARSAGAAVESAAAALKTSLSDADGKKFVVAFREATDARAIAAAVGDPDEQELERIDKADVFQLLSRAFGSRVTALEKLLSQGRKHLSAVVGHEATIGNLPWAERVLIDDQRQRVRQIEEHVRYSSQAAEACRQRVVWIGEGRPAMELPSMNENSAVSFLDAVRAPLPEAAPAPVVATA